MRTRMTLIFALLLLVTAACGSKKSNSSTSTSGPKTIAIDVDMASDPGVNVGTTAFFPSQVSAHPGDTVKFENYFTGEPHTVTLGTLVNAGLAATQGLAPGAAEPPALAKLPLLLPQGPGDAPQVAANPCFIATGDLPTDLTKPCPVRTATPFTGREAFYSSGFLASGTDFPVKLASDVAPGKYSFFCLLHRAAMTGTITVVPKSQTVPTPAEVSKSTNALEKAVIDQLQPAVTAATTAGAATPGKVGAGIGAAAVQNGEADVFAPTSTSIPVGGSVAWSVSGPHTITFNPTDDSRLGLVKAPDGFFHANPKAFAPVGGPGQPGGPPSNSPVVVDGGSYNGTGVHSSGILLAFGPPGSFTYKMTFTKAGTYSYECLVHPRMAGTVKVA